MLITTSMAAWDNHPACRSCMRKTGQICSDSQPCGVCRTWSAETWVKVKIAELSLANRRINRAKAHLKGEMERSGTGQTSCPRIRDSGAITSERCDPRIGARPKGKAGPRFEAPSKGSARLFKIPRLAPATATGNRHDRAKASIRGHEGKPNSTDAPDPSFGRGPP